MLLKAGTLYVVATPIGNLEDLTFRAVHVLSSVDIIAAEDTRHAAKLLTRHGISTRRTSLHEHNEYHKTPGLIARLDRGETIALVSDAGTPLISDPGSRLVAATIKNGLHVQSIPGPSAVIAALVSSGLAASPFTFVGFPPSRTNARKLWYENLFVGDRTFVLFEVPHRLKKSLEDLRETIGDQEIAVCRELTKINEQMLFGTISLTLEKLTDPRGEFTIVVKNKEKQATNLTQKADNGHMHKDFCHLIEFGLPRRAALRAVASKYGVASRVVYQEIEQSKMESQELD